MSKRNISYIKPQEPSFLRRLKEEIGYKEGPTVDTKRQTLSDCEGDNSNDEQPTVVVLRPGDLTAEEAEKEKQRLEKEAEDTPADLSAKIVFKTPAKSKKEEEEPKEKGKKRESSDKSTKCKNKRPKQKSLLSFDAEEDDEN